MLKSLRAKLRRVVPHSIRVPRAQAYYTALARRRSGERVMAGPFKGMRYIDRAVGSAYVPKLLGIYERELYSIIEEISSNNPSVIVDVGAAEGYYAIGLARRLPGVQVVAFELTVDGRDALAEMAAINGVADRVAILGACESPEAIGNALGGSPGVVIMDVEGFESVLLDPIRAPQLTGCTILVELHEFAVAGITQMIERRFENSHTIDLIWSEERSPSDFPWSTPLTKLLPSQCLYDAVREWRPPGMAWFVMRPIKV